MTEQHIRDAERTAELVVSTSAPAVTPDTEWPELEQIDWPKRDDRAFYGLAGDIARTIEPHSEADPMALLVQTLDSFGNAVGAQPHFMAEADRHSMNLFAALVGQTSKARKGTAWGRVKQVFITAEPEWENCITAGLSSGEGLIWQVRDPIEKLENVKEGGRVIAQERVVVDEGVADKRLMLVEGELALVFKVLGREGNTLSAIIRNAWDSGNLRSLTKNSPARATGAHISLVGHITRDELLRYLSDTEAANGFGNRFLWVCVRRSKVLPEGGWLSWEDLVTLADRLREALTFARGVGEMRRNEEARAIWRAVYPTLSEGRPGLLGGMLARAEAQVMRLSCIYALLDMSTEVRPEHLRAALATWEYCEASAEYIFGDSLGDPDADEILRAVRRAPEGLTRTNIHELFGRHRRGDAIARALTRLTGQGLVRCAVEATGGRPAERYYAVRS